MSQVMIQCAGSEVLSCKCAESGWEQMGETHAMEGTHQPCAVGLCSYSSFLVVFPEIIKMPQIKSKS